MFRFSLVCVIGLWAVQSAAANWAAALFDEQNRDFGSVPHGPTLSHPFRLTNKTKDNVHISNVRVSCGCVTASAQKADLAPGESTAIMAQMDTNRFYGHKTVTIFVQFDRPEWSEVALTVQANSRDDVAISPDTLAYGRIKRGKGANGSLTITFLRNGQLQILEVRSESNYVQPTVKETRRTDYEVNYQLSANIRPDLPVGKWYTDLWLKTNHLAAPQIRVPVTVEVEPALSVTPANMHMGTAKAGEVVEKKVIVRGESPFRITGVKGGDSDLAVEDIGNDAKPMHVLRLRMKAAKAGELKWNLRILTDLKDEGEIDFPAMATIVDGK